MAAPSTPVRGLGDFNSFVHSPEGRKWTFKAAKVLSDLSDQVEVPEAVSELAGAVGEEAGLAKLAYSPRDLFSAVSRFLDSVYEWWEHASPTNGQRFKMVREGAAMTGPAQDVLKLTAIVASFSLDSPLFRGIALVSSASLAFTMGCKSYESASQFWYRKKYTAVTSRWTREDPVSRWFAASELGKYASYTALGALGVAKYFGCYDSLTTRFVFTSISVSILFFKAVAFYLKNEGKWEVPTKHEETKNIFGSAKDRYEVKDMGPETFETLFDVVKRLSLTADIGWVDSRAELVGNAGAIFSPVKLVGGVTELIGRVTGYHKTGDSLRKHITSAGWTVFHGAKTAMYFNRKEIISIGEDKMHVVKALAWGPLFVLSICELVEACDRFMMSQARAENSNASTSNLNWHQRNLDLLKVVQQVTLVAISTILLVNTGLGYAGVEAVGAAATLLSSDMTLVLTVAYHSLNFLNAAYSVGQKTNARWVADHTPLAVDFEDYG